MEWMGIDSIHGLALYEYLLMYCPFFLYTDAIQDRKIPKTTYVAVILDLHCGIANIMPHPFPDLKATNLS